jgi:uncharacterized protein
VKKLAFQEKIIPVIIVLTVFFLGTVFGVLLSDQTNFNFTGLTIAKQGLTPLEKEFLTEIPIVAVVQGQQKGVISEAVVELRQGHGRILFNTNPFVEPDTQQSIEIAASVAEKLTGKSLEKIDVIYSIKNVNARLVGGPSAGAAFTIATIAAIKGKHLSKDVAITGTILPDGRIGQVGGLIEKMTALGENGVKIFLVPKGQRIVTVYQQQVEEKRAPGIIIQNISYVPKTIDLNDYALKEFGMQVIEVSSIQEALKYFF